MYLQQGFNLMMALSALVGAIGCSGDDDDGAGSGGGGARNASASSSSSSASSGGGGMPMTPTFTLSIVPITVEIPYGGQTTIDLKVNRFYGFDKAVEVAVSAPPPGLVAMPLTLPADASSAALQVGASGDLTVGSQFDLKLFATSDNKLSVAAVPTTVVAGP